MRPFNFHTAVDKFEKKKKNRNWKQTGMEKIVSEDRGGESESTGDDNEARVEEGRGDAMERGR